MGSRPLRHYYTDTGIELTVDPVLGDVVEPWTHHRDRFEKVLASLTEEQWRAQSRCDAWTNLDVINHLVDVDAFWALTLESGRSGVPTTYLENFDPSATPVLLVDSRAALSTAEILAAFSANAARLRETVEAFDGADWESVCESPIGHVSARLMLAHALWDSWLHERDILVGLGLDDVPELDELAVATWYSLLIGGAQGGVLDDPSPVGAGPSGPLDAQVQFDELPETPFRVVVDTGVRIGPTDPVTPAGSAVQFVEAFTGRLGTFPPDDVTLDDQLLAQLVRGREIL